MEYEKLLLIFLVWTGVEAIKWLVNRKAQTLTELEHEILMKIHKNTEKSVEITKANRRDIVKTEQLQHEAALILKELSWNQKRIASLIDKIESRLSD